MDDAGIKFMHSEGSNPCFMYAAECELFWSFQHVPVGQSAEDLFLCSIWLLVAACEAMGTGAVAGPHSSVSPGSSTLLSKMQTT
ncbi:unnamed protein product [Arctogadus glacialis]